MSGREQGSTESVETPVKASNRWVDTPFPLSNGRTVWIRYPLGEVPEEDVPRLATFVAALFSSRWVDWELVAFDCPEGDCIGEGCRAGYCARRDEPA